MFTAHTPVVWHVPVPPEAIVQDVPHTQLPEPTPPSQGAKSQLGGTRPTLFPFGQILASMVQTPPPPELLQSGVAKFTAHCPLDWQVPQPPEVIVHSEPQVQDPPEPPPQGQLLPPWL